MRGSFFISSPAPLQCLCETLSQFSFCYEIFSTFFAGRKLQSTPSFFVERKSKEFTVLSVRTESTKEPFKEKPFWSGFSLKILFPPPRARRPLEPVEFPYSGSYRDIESRTSSLLDKPYLCLQMNTGFSRVTDPCTLEKRIFKGKPVRKVFP